MNVWANAVITDKGLALQAKLYEGTTLNITRAVTGTGSVTAGLLSKQTAVSGQKQQLVFRTATYPEEGKCALACNLSNEGLSSGYTANQVGIYATDPDEGEILFFLAQASSGSGTIIPSESEMPGYSAEWTFYFQYGLADGVTVTVDPAGTVTPAIMESYVIQAINERAMRYLGQNPITTVEADTVDAWCALGSGYARFNADGTVVGKPSNYGLVLSLVGNKEVYQIWRVMDRGPTFQRSGNAANGWTNWAKVFDENSKPVMTTSEVGRAVTVGCGANGVAGWYPIGVIPANSAFYTYNVQLSVLGNGGRGRGILDIFIRTDDTAGELDAVVSYIKFTACTGGLIPEHFAIDMSSGDAVLYVYCPAKYTRYHVGIISEAYGSSDNGTGANFMILTRNYQETPVSGTNYRTSITQTMVASPEGAGSTHADSHATGGKDPLTPDMIGAGYSQRSVAVGSSETTVDGWYKVGTVDISIAYRTYSALLAVQCNGNRGSGILQMTIRTEETAGVLNLTDSSLEWLARDNGMPVDVFAIDASDRTNAVLWVKITANYQHYHISVLAEKFGAENAANTPEKQLLKLTRNQGNATAVTTAANITQTITSRHLVVVGASENQGLAHVRNVVMTPTDPGAGAATSHADGTVVLVYE